MTLEKACDRLAEAICYAVEEHGASSFTPGELYTFHGGPRPTLAGRIGTRFLASLNDRLKPHGLVAGYTDKVPMPALQKDNRWFNVTRLVQR